MNIMLLFTTLIVRVTLISRFVLYRKIREINVSRQLHVIVCILHFVPSLYFALSLQSAFITDRAPVAFYLESVCLFYS